VKEIPKIFVGEHAFEFPKALFRLGKVEFRRDKDTRFRDQDLRERPQLAFQHFEGCLPVLVG